MYLASAKKILVERDQMGIEWPPVFLLMATLYHQLGLDPATTTVDNPSGRPVRVVDLDPIAELVG